MSDHDIPTPPASPDAPDSTPTDATDSAAEFRYPRFTWPEAYEPFFDHLRRARLEKGLPLSKIAKRISIPLAWADAFENGNAPLDFMFIRMWCEAVGVPFDEFRAIFRAVGTAGEDAPVDVEGSDS